MQDEDLKLARKRSRRFTCSVIGAGVAFFALFVAIMFCGNQLAAVSTFTLEAAPGETVEGGSGALYSVAYAATIDDQAASTERL